MKRVLLLVAILLACVVQVYGKGTGGHNRATHAAKCATCPRDAHGRIARSPAVVKEFERQTGHVGGWPGHVVDHRVPLCAGGADAVWNMQWQTIAEAHAKDAIERTQCR